MLVALKAEQCSNSYIFCRLKSQFETKNLSLRRMMLVNVGQDVFNNVLVLCAKAVLVNDAYKRYILQTKQACSTLVLRRVDK